MIKYNTKIFSRRWVLDDNKSQVGYNTEIFSRGEVLKKINSNLKLDTTQKYSIKYWETIRKNNKIIFNSNLIFDTTKKYRTFILIFFCKEAKR
jgi:hypothetical protein